MIKLILLAGIFLSPKGSAQIPGGESIDVVQIQASRWTDENTLHLTFSALPDHRIYKDSLSMAPAFGTDITFKHLSVTPTQTFHDKYSGKDKVGVSGTFDLTVQVFALKEIKNANYPLRLQYQACSDEYCLFPQEFQFDVPMFVEDSSLSLGRLMSVGLPIALVFVFFAGFLTSLTPCIFPMIPMTMAVLIPRGQSLSFSQRLFRSVNYVLGIAVTYSVLGLIAAQTGQIFGSFLGNTWVALAIGIFFVAFGLSMLGFFEIQTPRFLAQSPIYHRSNTFLIGLAAGIIAGPCVGPVLLSILTYISKSGDIFAGFFLMMSFAFGMGLIFILLGVSGDLAKMLPRSGRWLEGPKYIFALSMFVLSIYYVRPVLSANHLLAYIGAVCSIVLLCYLLLSKSRTGRALPGRFRFFVYLLLTITLAQTVFYSLIADVTPANGNIVENGWQLVADERLEDLMQNGKPTVLDFYADWCLSCKEMKAVTFSDESVKTAGNAFNRLVIDATRNSEVVERLKKEHHVMGLPTILFFDRTGKKIESLTLTGFESPELFRLRLNKVLHQGEIQ